MPELNTFPSNFCQQLMLEGILASIGSVGDAYDNALAESTIGLFKTEAIRRGNPFHSGPFKNIDDIEYAGLELGRLVQQPPLALIPGLRATRRIRT